MNFLNKVIKILTTLTTLALWVWGYEKAEPEVEPAQRHPHGDPGVGRRLQNSLGSAEAVAVLAKIKPMPPDKAWAAVNEALKGGAQ